MDLAILAHHACNVMPRSETNGLAAQLRRAATSIPSSIAEGHARRSVKEYVDFLHVARGSMAELETQLLLAQTVGYLPDSEATDLQGRIDKVGRILNVVGLNRRQ